MVTVAVVYHSGYGHTKALAESVAKGVASVPGTKADLINVDDVESKWDDLAKADGIIFGAPTYMGSLSGPFKSFMDASSKVWFGQGWKNKVAAGFTNSASQSGDKLNSLLQLTVFAAQHSMIWVGSGMMPGNNASTASIEDVNRLGSFLGLMAQSNSDQGPDVAPPAQDHKTANLFGERVAHATHRWVKGGE